MNYIGCKYSLIGEISSVLARHGVPPHGPALDLFAGTGSVAQFLKSRGHSVFVNDWQHYAYVTNQALVGCNAVPSFDRLLSSPRWGRLIESSSKPLTIPVYSLSKRSHEPHSEPGHTVLAFLQQLDGSRGRFFEAYCAGGAGQRLYFSMENGLRIQTMRDTIENWSNDNLIGEQERAWLIACLIESADRVANTAAVYGAYLKRLKKTALRPITLCALVPESSPTGDQSHHIYCEDATTLLAKLSNVRFNLVYLDPPYNSRQYAANYHLLETISRWDLDDFEPRGKTGLRPSKMQRSAFCMRSSADIAYQKLFELMNTEYLLFSYNNEGLLSKPDLQNLLRQYCTDVQFCEIGFRRFRADVDRVNRVYKGDETQEYLILARPERDVQPAFFELWEQGFNSEERVNPCRETVLASPRAV